MRRPLALLPPGVRYMVASAFYFSVMSLLVKLAGVRLPSQEIVLARGVVTLVISYWLLRRGRIALWGTNKRLLLTRGLFGFAALSCFYYSLTTLPIAEATVLQYTNPIFTAFAAAWFLRERLTAGVLASAAVGLVGVTLVARPGFLFGAAAADLNIVAVAIALVGAILSAGAYTAVRKLSQTEHPLVIVFYFPLVAVPATIPTMAPVAVWPRGADWLLLLGVGVTTQIAQIYLTKGLARESAGRAMTIGYSQVLFAGLWGTLLFSERPDLLSLVGALLLLGGTVAAAVRPSRTTANRAARAVAGRS